VSSIFEVKMVVLYTSVTTNKLLKMEYQTTHGLNLELHETNDLMHGLDSNFNTFVDDFEHNVILFLMK
jgi:hypothetical protein